MADEPDMRFDIGLLFEHLVENLEHNIADEQDWTFSLRSEDVKALEAVGHELVEEFIVRIQETVEEIDVDGNSSFGAPMLSVIRRAALDQQDVQELADRISSLAKQRGLSYEGVECYEPIDEEDLFGWLAPVEAGGRLRHLTDCGLELNAELPWVFYIQTPDLKSTIKLADKLEVAGFRDRDDYEEPDDEGFFGHCMFVSGRNNETELMEMAAQIEEISKPHGGSLKGVQFYSREEVNELFQD